MSHPFSLSVLLASLLALALTLSLASPAQAQTAATSKPASPSKKKKEDKKFDLKEALTDLQTQAKEIGNDMIEKNDLEPLKKVELNSNAREAKTLELMINHFINLQNQYQAEIKVLEWESFLSPERLQRDQDQSQTKKMIASAKQAFARYEAGFLDRQPLYDMAKQWSSNPLEQNGFKTGVNRALDRKMPLIQKQLAVERKIMAKLEELAAILGGNLKLWKYENEQMLFSDDALLAKFNAEYASFNQLVAEQDALLKESLEDGLRNLEKVKNSL